MITIKRVYEPPTLADGYRVLVDRLWPRGVSKDAAALDEWLKDVTPSDELRRWVHYDLTRWPEFEMRYRLELSAPVALPHIERLRGISSQQTLSLLTAVRDAEVNHVKVLIRIIENA